MTKYFFIVFALAVSQLGFGQSISHRRMATEKEQELFERSHDCTKQTNKSFSQRIKNYPFDKASQIQLVSFKSTNDTLNGVVIKSQDSLPRKNDTICYSKLFEVKNLNYAQVDRLTDILYNYGYQKKVKYNGLLYIATTTLCYIPRNAILFLNEKGKAFEFIEICFECSKTRESSSQISLGVMCNQKLDLLRDLFKKAGLEYGITKGVIEDE